MAYQVSGNTWGYWPFDEPVGQHQDYQTAVDTQSFFSLTQATATDRPYILGGPGTVLNGQLCRWFPTYNSTTSRLVNTSPPAAFTTMMASGSFTIEAWVYPTLLSGEQVILGLANDALRFESNGTQLRAYWNSGVVQTVSGGTLTLNTWQHVAVTVSASAPNRTVELFVSGSSVGSGTAALPTGGGSDDMALGNMPATALQWRGGIADVRVSSVVRSPGEILASATDPTYLHTEDGSTYVLWRFVESPEVYDASGQGHHMSTIGLDPVNTLEAKPSLIRATGYSRGGFAAITGSVGCILPEHPDITTLAQGDGKSWTFNCWIRALSGVTADVVPFGLAGSGEAQETNSLAYVLIINVQTTRILRILIERNAGVDTLIDTTTEIFPTEERYDAHMISIVRHDQGGGFSIWRVYIDGSLHYTSSSLANPTHGTQVPYRVNIPANAVIDDVSLEYGVRDATSLLAEFQDGDPSATGTGTASLEYSMRALANPGPGKVYWVVPDAPDFAGAFAPSAIQGGTAVVTSQWNVPTIQQQPIKGAFGYVQSTAVATTASNPNGGVLLVVVDTSAGSWSDLDSITLPASPETRQEIVVKDGGGQAHVKRITVNGNGHTIEGLASTVMANPYQAFTLIFDGTEWTLV